MQSTWQRVKHIAFFQVIWSLISFIKLRCSPRGTELKNVVFVQVIGSLIPLGLICMTVTFGNILVILAVRQEKNYDIQLFVSGMLI